MVEILTAPDDIEGAFQAYTAFSYSGYRGPQPYPGELHHYRFIVYALDAKLDLPQALGANVVLERIERHILAQGELQVTYQRELAK